MVTAGLLDEIVGGCVTVAIWILSVLTIAEFTFAPFNLWSGRTMPNFIRFTGLPPTIARRVLAPAIMWFLPSI